MNQASAFATRLFPPARTRRRGSAYVTVVGVAMLVTVIGLSALLAARIGTRMTVGDNDSVEADALATSAVEQALTVVNTNPKWRVWYLSGKENGPYTLGRGTTTWSLVDESDGDLANDANGVARLYGTGTVGRARRVYRVQLQPAGPGLEVLKKPAHASAAITVQSSTVTLTASGGPLSTDGRFTGNGTINADVEAGDCAGGAAIRGSVRTGVSPRPMPSSSAFDLYLPRATEISWDQVASAGISGTLSAASNPFGKVNPKGIYHVRVPGSAQLKINNARLQATLLVTADVGGRVVAGPALLWDPPRAQMPSLIARGPDVRVSLDSATGGLTEVTAGRSLNPTGTPYNGVADDDLLDTYPAEVHGLFHAIGKSAVIEIGANLHATGCLLTDGTIVVGNGQVPVVMNISLAADPALFATPPAGYATGEQMAPAEGTWERRASQ